MMHVIVNLWKGRCGKGLVQGLDLALGGESKGLVCVLAVTDVGTDNPLGEENGPEDCGSRTLDISYSIQA